MKNILITGVAGMIGSNLLEKLLKKKNLNIIGLDNFTLGKKKYIKPFLKFKNFSMSILTLVKMDQLILRFKCKCMGFFLIGLFNNA